MQTELSVVATQQTVYQVKHLGEWADITVASGQSNPELYGRDTGWVKVSIHSSYGNYGHFWNSIGPGHWSDFLNHLDIDYAMGKLMGSREMREFDAVKTAQGLRQHIIEQRRHGWYDREEAREAWTDIEDIEHSNNETDFMNTLAYTKAFRDEFWEWSRYSIKPSVVGFWDRVWRPWIMMVANTQGLRDAA